MISRRALVKGSLMTVAAAARPLRAFALESPFKVAVISDEISQDFDHACYVIAKEFGLQWVELRAMWGKNLQASSADEITRAQGILQKYRLRVTDIASPLYKVYWPGAPKSKENTSGDLHGADETNFKQQAEVLERSIALAKQFGTDKVRCFDFWRIENVAPYRKAINGVLQEAAEKAKASGVLLLLENEFECNTATGREAAATLAGVPSRNLALNWDPGNAVMRGELDAFPVGWNLLPKERIHHCHVKSAMKDATGKMVWAPVGKGYVDWTGQFRALKAMGYHDAVSLETHWTGGGSPEASSRISWAGMKTALEHAGALS